MSSDNFNAGSLDAKWTDTDPSGDCSLDLSDNAHLKIVLPSGAAHDYFNATATGPRVTQAYSSGDLDIACEMDSPPPIGGADSTAICVQGLIVMTSTGHVRWDTHNGSTVFNFFCGSNVGGTTTTRLNTTATRSDPFHLRLTYATGTGVWTGYSSTDGSSWTQRVQWTQSLTIQSYGVWAGNANGGSGVPAFTAQFDSFTDTAAGGGSAAGPLVAGKLVGRSALLGRLIA